MSLHCSATFVKKKKLGVFWSTRGTEHSVAGAMDWREAPGKAKAYLYGAGQGKQIEGWALAVPTMRLGEECKLEISGGYAYGAEGLTAWKIVREPRLRLKGVLPFSPAHTQTCRRTHRPAGAHTNPYKPSPPFHPQFFHPQKKSRRAVSGDPEW
jgi:hypothetical protein